MDETQIAELQEHVDSRRHMLKRLDEIYKSAFDGPSPDFPEEDSAEEELRNAELHYEEVSRT
jgi:hypothetical protein